MIELNIAIAKVITDIEQYYDFSFRMWPEKCIPVVFVLIEHIEEVFPLLTAKQTTRLNGILKKVIEALEVKDYVRMRDCLYYDLRQLLHSFQSEKHNNIKKYKH